MERDIYLTEAIYPTHKGNKYIPINFLTWENFGRLWEWCQKQEWWNNFEFKYCCAISITIKLIHPDNFADAVYEYLKALEEV